MSIHEIESKIRELRQLQSLIEEATAEAEAIKDAIKASMGDSEELRARGVSSYLEAREGRQNRHQGPPGSHARGCPSFHPGNHHPSILRGMRRRGHADTHQSNSSQVSGLLLWIG